MQMVNPRLPMTREEVLWARDRAAEGYSAAQIARSLKRNPETVRRALRGDTHQRVEMPLGAGLAGPTVAELQPPLGRPQVDPAPMTQAERESLKKLQGLLAMQQAEEGVGEEVRRKALELGTHRREEEGPAGNFLDELGGGGGE